MFSQLGLGLGLGHNSHVLESNQILPNNSTFNHTAVCLWWLKDLVMCYVCL